MSVAQHTYLRYWSPKHNPQRLRSVQAMCVLVCVCTYVLHRVPVYNLWRVIRLGTWCRRRCQRCRSSFSRTGWQTRLARRCCTVDMHFVLNYLFKIILILIKCWPYSLHSVAYVQQYSIVWRRLLVANGADDNVRLWNGIAQSVDIMMYIKHTHTNSRLYVLGHAIPV